jgi:hypothetical protein
MLRWEDDPTVEPDFIALEKLFRERYNFRTETWGIPSCPNPNVKLSMQLARQVEYTRPGHLLVVYYAGYSFIGSDDNLYWAWYGTLWSTWKTTNTRPVILVKIPLD